MIRLQVNGDGSLTARDFFSPYNNSRLDQDDTDFGSGGPMALPAGFGTAAHPRLMVQTGKDGRVYLLDRDNLGGNAQGPGGTDASVGPPAGPYNGVWGHPAFWRGDGGYVYQVENQGFLRAFKYGVNGAGLPVLTLGRHQRVDVRLHLGLAGRHVHRHHVGLGHRLGRLQRRVHRRQRPAAGLRRAAGQRPAQPALLGADRHRHEVRHAGHRRQPGLRRHPRRPDLRLRPAHHLGADQHPDRLRQRRRRQTANATVTVTATRAVTISAITTSAPFGATPPALPVTLNTGQTLSVPVRFTPTGPAAPPAACSFTTDAGNVPLDLHGTGTQVGLGATPSTLAFGTVPTGANKTLSVSITNTGTPR